MVDAENGQKVLQGFVCVDAGSEECIQVGKIDGDAHCGGRGKACSANDHASPAQGMEGSELGTRLTEGRDVPLMLG
jgi:hypothetical protein